MLQRWLPKVPAVLVMVSLSGHGVSLVGVLP